MAKTIRVKLQVAPDVYELAKARFRELGYFSPVDYLNAARNTAMLQEMEIAGKPDPFLMEPPERDEPEGDDDLPL